LEQQLFLASFGAFLLVELVSCSSSSSRRLAVAAAAEISAPFLLLYPSWFALLSFFPFGIRLIASRRSLAVCLADSEQLVSCCASCIALLAFAEFPFAVALLFALLLHCTALPSLQLLCFVACPAGHRSIALHCIALQVECSSLELFGKHL
jgi:hypothetical protein